MTKDEFNKIEVIKHSSVIQSEGKMSLVQAKCYNIFIANAFDQILEDEEHQIKLSILSECIGYDCNRNDQNLKSLLKEIVGKLVEYNLLGKDGKNKWGVTTPLAHCTIEDGVCKYSFSKPLRELYANPTIYSKIKLTIQNRFKSKHSLFLYELCFDYMIQQMAQGKTPWMKLEKFKKLMGLSENEYINFKDLNKYVIKASVKEINEKTDIYIEVRQKKEGRKVSFLQFCVRKNPNYQNDIVISKNQMKLFEVPDQLLLTSEQHEIKEKLIKLAISEKEAEKIVNSHDTKKIKDSLELLKMEKAKGRVQNPKTWFLACLNKDFDMGELETKRRKEEVAKKRAEEFQRQQEAREAQRLKLEQEKKERIDKWIKENPEGFDQLCQDCIDRNVPGVAYFKEKAREQGQEGKALELAKQNPMFLGVVRSDVEKLFTHKKTL